MASRLRGIEAAAAAGLLFSVGALVSFSLLLGTLDLGASSGLVAAYHARPGAGASVTFAVSSLSLAVVGLLWFIAVIRGRIGDHEPKLFGTVFLGSGILVAALMLVAGVSLAAPASLVHYGGLAPDPGVSSMSRAVGATLLVLVLPRIEALFIFSTGSLALRTGVLPRWLVWATYLTGLALFLNATFFTPGIYAFPLWVGVVSIVMLARPKKADLALLGPDR